MYEQKRLEEARIMIVGCGALGNEVLKNLILLGAKHLVLVDFDRVEPGNLSRSILFTRADAEKGSRKVEAAAHALHAINPEADIVTIDGDIAYDVGLGLIRRMDVVIGCVDSRWARYCINRLCMRAGVPWVDGGITMNEGTARVFVPGRNCYACSLGTEGRNELRRRFSCANTIRRQQEEGHVPTSPLTASIVAAVQVEEALKLLTAPLNPHSPTNLPKGEANISSPFGGVEGAFGGAVGAVSLCGKMYYHDSLSLTTRVVDFQAYDEDCLVHERWSPVTETLATDSTSVRDFLQQLSTQYDTQEVSFTLTDDCFVDYVTCRVSDNHVSVMRAARFVADVLPADRLDLYYQHEYSEIDHTFPYPDLTLRDLGLPPQAILPVTVADRNRYYIELT